MKSSRVSLRDRTQCNATVLANDGTEFECLLRDVSDAGARLTAPIGRQIGEVSSVKLEGFDEAWSCRVIWRHAGEIGLQFT